MLSYVNRATPLLLLIGWYEYVQNIEYISCIACMRSHMHTFRYVQCAYKYIKNSICSVARTYDVPIAVYMVQYIWLVGSAEGITRAILTLRTF